MRKKATLYFGAALAGALIVAGIARAQTIDLAATRIVDLSHAYDADTLYWPTEPTGFQLRQEHKGQTKGGFFYYSNAFCSPEHGGTHIDAPMHFAEHGWTNSDIPLDRLVARAVVIDIADKTAKNPDYLLTTKDIAVWEAAHGRIPDDAMVFLRTGWSARWPNRKAYLGDDKPGDASNLHFPSFGPGAATYLVRERHVRALGVDTASVDNGPSHDFQVHRILGASNVAGLENLTNLDQLPPTGAIIVAAPMKIAHGSGAPTRVMAFVPK